MSHNWHEICSAECVEISPQNVWKFLHIYFGTIFVSCARAVIYIYRWWGICNTAQYGAIWWIWWRIFNFSRFGTVVDYILVLTNKIKTTKNDTNRNHQKNRRHHLPARILGHRNYTSACGTIARNCRYLRKYVQFRAP